MERTPFTVATQSGELSGWVTGEGPRVLAVHGGPGMSYDYLDDAVAELAARYQVATFQQRGLAPSTEQGEFTVAEAVADIAAVLDGLGWDTAYLMGHSWGGHLVFHAAAASPSDWPACLSVDPLGAVGDGGAEAFGAEMLARVPEADRERARAAGREGQRGRGDAGGGRSRRSPWSGRPTSPTLLPPPRCRAWSSPSPPARGCGPICRPGCPSSRRRWRRSGSRSAWSSAS